MSLSFDKILSHLNEILLYEPRKHVRLKNFNCKLVLQIGNIPREAKDLPDDT